MRELITDHMRSEAMRLSGRDTAASLLHDAADEIDNLREYETAVDEACVVCWIPQEGQTPRELLQKLQVFAGQIALDPQVSADAAKLHGEIDRLRARVAELEGNRAESPRDWQDQFEAVRPGVAPGGGVPTSSPPAGWVMVPVEPSSAMIEAARAHHEGQPYLPHSLYCAMLAAAPKPPAADPLQELVTLTEDLMPDAYAIPDNDGALRFAGKVLAANQGGAGNMDGWVIQSWAVEAGLLNMVIATEPCGEQCECAATGGFPEECYRLTDAGRAAVEAGKA